MTARTLRLWTIALTIALSPQIGLAQPAIAEDVEICRGIDQDLGPAPDADAAIAAFMDGLDFGCFGQTGCATTLCAAVASFEAIDDEATLRQETGAVAEQVDDVAMSLPEVAALAPLRETFIRWRILGQLVLDGREDEIPALIGTNDNIWGVVDGKLFAGRPANAPPAEIDLFALIDDACVEPGPACRAGFELAGNAAAAVNLQRRIVARLSLAERVDIAERSRRADARWSSFFGAARSQLPWELLINSRLYDAERDPLAIEGPPSAQWIVLHPSVGVGYREADFNQALVLELVGYYRWEWGGENKDRVSWPFGGSLVLSFDGDDDPAFGAMLHLPRNWSLGATIDRDENVSFLLSVDLAKLFQSDTQVRRVMTGGSLF